MLARGAARLAALRRPNLRCQCRDRVGPRQPAARTDRLIADSRVASPCSRHSWLPAAGHQESFVSGGFLAGCRWSWPSCRARRLRRSSRSRRWIPNRRLGRPRESRCGIKRSELQPPSRPISTMPPAAETVGSGHEPGRCWAPRACDAPDIRLNPESEAADRSPACTGPGSAAQRGGRLAEIDAD